MLDSKKLPRCVVEGCFRSPLGFLLSGRASFLRSRRIGHRSFCNSSGLGLFLNVNMYVDMYVNWFQKLDSKVESQHPIRIEDRYNSFTEIVNDHSMTKEVLLSRTLSPKEVYTV
jgi:hypothetical protein